MPANPATVAKLLDALNDPKNKLAAAKDDPALGPLLSKLDASDLDALRKLANDAGTLSFCNGTK